jgi:hypothetical protein
MGIAGIFFRKLIIDRKSNGLTLPQLRENLQQETQAVLHHHTQAADTEKNKAQMRHIIGIERWGQSRLRTLLGEPLLTREEYDNYAPADSLSMAELGETFAETRERLLGLIGELENAGISPTKTIPHNQMGNMTLRSWLYYLNFHATNEARQIKMDDV